VFHVKHGYLDLWRRYNRVLKQRNAALRQANRAVVESLDPQFVQLGEKLDKARQAYLGLMEELLRESLPAISPALEDITLSYRKGWPGDNLEEALMASRQRDIDRGATHPGPHKADLYLSVEGAPARERLSRGEQKAMTAALIIAQASTICASGEKPVLLLDDLFSEFDDEHLARVLAQAMNLGVQVWLTGTRSSPAIEVFKGAYSMFHVEHGKVSQAQA
jgi:DNA replication and repair protein RecF